MGRAPLSHEAFAEALLVAGAAVIASKDELTKLDAAAGDGDLGATMERGFRAAHEQVTSSPPESAEAALRAVGEALTSKAPSTMGTLFGAGLMMAAASLKGRDGIDGTEFAAMLEGISDGIREFGHASLGQRTALDAMVPAAVRAREAVDSGSTSPRAVLTPACDAADEGAQRTADMVPSVGRARWTGDRSAGVVDGGARAFAIWLRGLLVGLPAD